MNNFLAFIGCIALVLFFLAILFHGKVELQLDSTDDHVTGKRSGMRILVDHETGLQYLNTFPGGLTPRLDADGKHMRTTDEEVTR
ncbi:hypothetical protein ABO04_05145 [Nitrosomonas sp. HPC101]|uniref:DUF6440 family protein n=1 Tax=Nitrosomonas sp. HPC101 TaxID=1658667 RepID=UPI0013DD90FF|nr:DUF6440 family protein [Nitrosomonas sp. HPC101]MXS85320.1 hypothetical protein [Nitrosomonas sp. HPC101]